MAELERMLSRMGDEVEWPRTPALTVSVMVELEAAPPAAPPRRFARLLPPAGLRHSLALAVVALLVLAGGVFAAVPSVRDSVLDLFGLQGATVERRTKLPPAPPQRPLDLGRRTTLAAASGQLPFEPLVPAVLGDPDAVYVRRGPPGGELSVTYRKRGGGSLLLSEFRGDLAPQYLGKIAGQATTVERVRIDADRGIWIEGAPHFFFYRAPGGRFVDTELRLAQNVLLLERGKLLVRLEGAFGRDRAVEIARSLR
jgi:hypothetical protein